MNIWNKVFLVLIFLLALGVVFFAAQEFKIRSAGQKTVLKLEDEQVKAEQEIDKILEGTAPEKPLPEKSYAEMGLEESRLKLFDLLFERKKAWFGCEPIKVTPQGQLIKPNPLDNQPATPDDQLKMVYLLEAVVAIKGPLIEHDGNEIVMSPEEDLKGIVYVFDEGREGVGGSFLGIFTVDSIQKMNNAYQAKLHSANELSESEIQRIDRSRASKATWTIYASIPTDRFDGVFNRLSEEAVEALPAALRKELMNPERPLKDFGEILNRRYQRRVELMQEIDSAKKDIALLGKSLELARAESEKLRENIEFEKKRVAAMDTQRQALQDMLKKYDDTITQLQSDIEQTQKQNQWYEEKIAEYQLKVRKVIEQRAERAAIE